jgi:hypothetical protein
VQKVRVFLKSSLIAEQKDYPLLSKGSIHIILSESETSTEAQEVSTKICQGLGCGLLQLFHLCIDHPR